MIYASARDVDALAAELLRMLGVTIASGQVTLNLNESKVQSIETKTFTRLDKALKDACEAPIAAGIEKMLDNARHKRA